MYPLRTEGFLPAGFLQENRYYCVHTERFTCLLYWHGVMSMANVMLARIIVKPRGPNAERPKRVAVCTLVHWTRRRCGWAWSTRQVAAQTRHPVLSQARVGGGCHVSYLRRLGSLPSFRQRRRRQNRQSQQ